MTIKDDSPAVSSFLRYKIISKCVANLLVRVAYLKADLIASIISIKEGSLDTNSLIACKLWFS